MSDALISKTEERRIMAGNYGSTSPIKVPQPKYGKQQSLLSAPPQSKQSVAITTPAAVASSSAPVVNTIHHLSKLIIYCYMIFGVASLVMTLLEFANFNKVALFAMLILGTILLSFAGALGLLYILPHIGSIYIFPFQYHLCSLQIPSSSGCIPFQGVYKWGTVEMQIERFKGENAKYESQIQSLNSTKMRLADQVRGIDATVSNLSKSADDLKKELKQFDQLRKELEEVAGKNQTINDMINDINGMYDGMKSAVIQNQRSSILQIFYEVQWKDDDHGLSKREYNRFKGRLDKETRERFEKYGSFESLAGVDGVIDLAEFSDLMEQILLDMEEATMRKHTGV